MSGTDSWITAADHVRLEEPCLEPSSERGVQGWVVMHMPAWGVTACVVESLRDILRDVQLQLSRTGTATYHGNAIWPDLMAIVITKQQQYRFTLVQ